MKNLEMNPANLKDKMAELDAEFKDYLSGLKFVKRFDDNDLKTFSPLDVVCHFEQRGLGKVHEVSKAEMKNNDDGLKKLLANMLQHCRPGVLTDDDVDQLSGINGREMRSEG